jgi:hypothetical protein
VIDVVVVSDVAGWLGAVALLAGYGLLSAGRIRAGWAYQLLNLAGSVGLGVNAVAHRAWPSAAVNTVWLVIALVAVRGVAMTRHRREAVEPSRRGGVESDPARSRGW